jgi:V8-like Glu-specific endopeptidase
MLQYQIDAYGGNSGSPVIVKEEHTSIGAHVYGGTFNSASVIGLYGDPYDDYVKAIDFVIPNDGGLHLVPVPTQITVTT